MRAVVMDDVELQVAVQPCLERPYQGDVDRSDLDRFGAKKGVRSRSGRIPPVFLEPVAVETYERPAARAARFRFPPVCRWGGGLTAIVTLGFVAPPAFAASSLMRRFGATSR
jgi:hypothetical protein